MLILGILQQTDKLCKNKKIIDFGVFIDGISAENALICVGLNDSDFDAYALKIPRRRLCAGSSPATSTIETGEIHKISPVLLSLRSVFCQISAQNRYFCAQFTVHSPFCQFLAKCTPANRSYSRCPRAVFSSFRIYYFHIFFIFQRYRPIKY